MTQDNEQALIAACAAGNAFAQQQLYNAFAGQMMVVCLRYVSNGEDAKEILLDGFYNCFRSIDRFMYQGAGSLSAWLKKIMINQCLMHLRKRKVLYTEEILPDTEITGDADGALAALSAKEILGLIHRLPGGYRTVFNLYSFEGMTHREIAVLLGISENTSKSQLHKARAALQAAVIKSHQI